MDSRSDRDEEIIPLASSKNDVKKNYGSRSGHLIFTLDSLPRDLFPEIIRQLIVVNGLVKIKKLNAAISNTEPTEPGMIFLWIENNVQCVCVIDYKSNKLIRQIDISELEDLLLPEENAGKNSVVSREVHILLSKCRFRNVYFCGATFKSTFNDLLNLRRVNKTFKRWIDEFNQFGEKIKAISSKGVKEEHHYTHCLGSSNTKSPMIYVCAGVGTIFWSIGVIASVIWMAGRSMNSGWERDFYILIASAIISLPAIILAICCLPKACFKLMDCFIDILQDSNTKAVHAYQNAKLENTVQIHSALKELSLFHDPADIVQIIPSEQRRCIIL